LIYRPETRATGSLTAPRRRRVSAGVAAASRLGAKWFAANGLRDDGRRSDRLGELHSWNHYHTQPVHCGSRRSHEDLGVRQHPATPRSGLNADA